MKNQNDGNILGSKVTRGPMLRHDRFILFAAIVLFLEMIPAFLFSQPLATGRGKFLGCATSSSIWPNLDQYWNQITPGNDGKWGSLEQVQGYYIHGTTWTTSILMLFREGFPLRNIILFGGSSSRHGLRLSTRPIRGQQ